MTDKSSIKLRKSNTQWCVYSLILGIISPSVFGLFFVLEHRTIPLMCLVASIVALVGLILGVLGIKGFRSFKWTFSVAGIIGILLCFADLLFWLYFLLLYFTY
jgi:membrane protein YdbS with pleckstrin-like domain